MRLIDASDKRNMLYVSQEVFDCMQRIPPIDPESLRPQGHWIGEADGYADGELVYDVWYCSEVIIASMMAQMTPICYPTSAPAVALI